MKCLGWLGATGLALASHANADLVTDWNGAFLDTVRRENTPPPLAARNLAILHAAIFDAVNSVTSENVPYKFPQPIAGQVSLEATVAGAAYAVSVNLFPSQAASFTSLYQEGLAAVPDGPAKVAGLALGTAVGHAFVEWRTADGASTQVPYIPSEEPGRWRRTPPFYRPPELPHWRYVEPFTLGEADQFRPSGPPPLDSRRYAEEVLQVQELGAANSLTRTPYQTETARFWSDFSYTATPPGHWNEIAQGIAQARGNTLPENARLFALLNLALADAGIAAWDAKYQYDFWRPVTAIREADRDDRPETTADPSWMPLLVTPAFPEYVSGHSTFSAAAATILARFYGTDAVHFSTTSDTLPGVVRTYDSLWSAAEEIGLSRIYGGIHFLSADLDGLALGATVGNYVFDNYLQPIPEPESVALLLVAGPVVWFALRHRRR